MLSRAANSLGRGASNLGGRLTLGGKLPIIGPIIMGYDTYMADADGDGEPDKKLDKALFVAGGSALGGLLAAGIPVIGPILGSLAGGYVGDLMYEMILGKGFATAGIRFKNDVVNVLKGSLAFGKHLTDSVGRFFSYLPKMKIAGFETAIPSPEIFTGSFDLMGALKAALFPGTFTFPEGGVTEEIVGRKNRGRSGAKRAMEERRKAKQDIQIPENINDDVEFKKAVTATANKLGVPERDLYAIMSFETGGTFDPAQKNLAGSGATGLIQFMPSTAKGLGTTTDELSRMSRAEQMKYVEQYFLNTGIPKGSNVSDLYMAVLFPAAIGKSDDFVLFGKGATVPGYGEGSRAYSQNSGLDLDGSGSITKYEASAKVRKELDRYSKGGKTKSGAHFILVGEKGSEYVLDADTTEALEDNYPRFLDRINKADYKGSLDVLRNYASYDVKETILVVQEIETVVHASKSSPLFA